MTTFKILLEFVSAIAWPAAVLAVALLYRKPINALLGHLGGIASRAAQEAVEISVGEYRLEFKNAVNASEPKDVEEAITIASEVAKKQLPYGKPVPGHPGFVYSPYLTEAVYVDVKGYESGTQVKDPWTGNIFLVP